MDLRPKYFIEHEGINSLDLPAEYSEQIGGILRSTKYDPDKATPLLGLDWDYSDRSLSTFKAKYFIGAQWIKEGESSIVVNPKIPHLDFMKMFLKCFDSDVADLRKELKTIYSIDIDAKPIEVDCLDFELTPLLIAHYLKLVSAITARGLKRDYIIREEPLYGKVKGKILLSKTIKRAFNSGRQDINDCRYQDYSIDNTDNRILKKALMFAQRYLQFNEVSCGTDLRAQSSACLSYFAEVSDDVSVQAIKHHKVNPLFREYKDALKLAKILLQRFGYSMSTTEENIDKKSVPPFWIDMSVLFELYVYALLKEKYGSNIIYHARTYGNEIDFAKTDEKLIIDTKYIPNWSTKNHHDNVRQLSGYARNITIRKVVDLQEDDETTILPIMVIYPAVGTTEPLPEKDLIKKELAVKEYIKLYRYEVELPIISNEYEQN